MAFTTKVASASRLFSTSQLRAAINEFVVVGGGLMGAGIAQVGAQTGHQVTLVDVSPDVLSKSQGRIEKSVSRVAKAKFKENPDQGAAFVEATMNNLKTATVDAAKDKFATADMVIEAVIENLDIKRKLFKEWDEICPAKTILTSNTSTLPIAKMAEVCPGRKDRFGGLHFFNPVPVMKLLEVIRIPETSDETFEAMMAWGKKMGKVCVQCKDTPGFIVNRLLVPYLTEAIAMVERGDATFKDVDTAMKLGAGYPMGPFELLDYVGLDLHLRICEDPNNPLSKPSKIIEELVKEGKCGMKTGEGFYKYNK